jgi:hypothetical protein
MLMQGVCVGVEMSAPHLCAGPQREKHLASECPEVSWEVVSFPLILHQNFPLAPASTDKANEPIQTAS